MTSAEAKTAPYGTWTSPIDLTTVNNTYCRKIIESRIDHSDVDAGTAYWIEQLHDGRSVICSLSAPFNINEIRQWNPEPLNADTLVHEYGKGAFTVYMGIVYYCTRDGGVYRQSKYDEMPVALVPPSDNKHADVRYAEPHYAYESLYIICEDHSKTKAQGGTEHYPINMVARIHPADAERSTVTIVASGADFYACVQCAPSGTKLVWMQWCHPNMPFEATEICLCELNSKGVPVIGSEKKVLGDGHTNYMQPQWGKDDRLFVIADTTDWWNVYEVDIVNGSLLRNLHRVDFDLGNPRWLFGGYNQTYVAEEYWFSDERDTNRVALAVNNTIVLANVNNDNHKIIPIQYSELHSLAWQTKGENAIYCVACAPDSPQALIRIDVDTEKVTIVREVFDRNLIAGKIGTLISVPELLVIHSPYENSPDTISGYYYPPVNSAFKAPKDSKPPLVVKLHGGPTGRTDAGFDWSKQIWTSRGFAILDLNYRGSTGNGRKYRDMLFGHCGVMDIDDAVAAAKYCVKHGLADAKKLCITGQSAGGYAVLCAISRKNAFSAAVSLYGISDLTTLMADTHKFESSYDVFANRCASDDERKRIYADRSPINHLDDICCPVAFFQGVEDKVVPPAQATQMYEAVKKKGLPTALVLFPREGHGFFDGEHIRQALFGTIYFMCAVLDIHPAPVDADIPDLIKIDNLKI